MTCSQAEVFKNLGNELIQKKEFEKAAENYTRAIQLCPDNYTYYSNRSAAYASLGKYDDALADAQKTVALNPVWPKGYSRLGAALEYLGRREDAKEAYENGLKHDPENSQLKNALKSLEEPNDNDFMKMFNNPEMQKLMRDPEFLKNLQKAQQDPSAMFSDPKLMNFMSQMYNKEDTAAYSKPENQSTKPEKFEEKKDIKKDFEKEEDNDIKKAEDEKIKGNKAYKEKNFAEAIEHYINAKKLNPNTITYDLNISATYFEEAKYDECIAVCEEAIEKGRQLKEPFKLIARALARIGSSYHKQSKFEEAIKYYKKSIAEFRDSEIIKKLGEAEKVLKEKQAKEYINPDIAEKERELGNKAFSSGDYVNAVKHYSESIKRCPFEAKTYSNRAAAYTKLMEYHLCVQDCNKSIELDPQFVKSYLRKANALLALRDPSQAKAAYEKVLSIDYNNREAYEGLSKCSEALNKLKPEEASEAAMRDPEVQEILADPSMRLALEQMQNEPGSAQSLLKDPNMLRKIEKLVSAGVIKIGHK